MVASRRRVLPRIRFLLLLIGVAILGVMQPASIKADTGAYGSVLIPGSAWAGSWAQYGNLNVYGNGSNTSTGVYQCTDLAERWANVRYGEPDVWDGNAATWWTRGPNMPIPWYQHPNGGPDLPQFGDLLIFGATSYDPTGHVAVVQSISPGYVTVVEQNWGPTGTATLPISGTTMPPRWGLPVLGWLRPSQAGGGGGWTQAQSGPGGYELDAYGGIHPYGSAAPVQTTGYWAGFPIAKNLIANSTDTSGLVLDGYGGLHPWAQPGTPMPAAPSVSGYWPGWDIARAAAFSPGSTTQGYVLDGYGGLHPFGGAPNVVVTGYWPGWDIATDVIVAADGHSGLVLDAYGGLHPFAEVGETMPATPTLSNYFGWNIARSAVYIAGSSTEGYVLDGFGGLSPFGGAPSITVNSYFPGIDTARGVKLNGSTGAYVGLATGVVVYDGDAPAVLADLPGLPLGRGIA